MSALSERPPRPVVGTAVPHESAALHVTGEALFTDDLGPRTAALLHAYPVQAPHAHARVTALRAEPALAVPGVLRVLTAADVPGSTMRASSTTSRCSPRRSCTSATRSAGSSQRRSSRPGSAPWPSRWTTSRCPP
jgi:xanthine dehydrogenase molybdopterin-binding subunit B